ncbi:MAG: putative membrane protein [Marinoscillum sp.]|jgi:putative membrane protein
MMTFVLVKYLHFVGIFMVVAALFTEMILVRREMTLSKLNLLSKVDGLYGMGAMISVGAGLVMWFAIGKPSDFYSSNFLFLTKVGLFTLVGIASIWPTVYFLKFRKSKGEDLTEVPFYLIWIIRFEVALLLILPLLAVTMANGISGV